MLLKLAKLFAGRDSAKQKQPRQCLMCGTCCKSFGGHLQASKRDLQRWTDLGREDILKWVGNNGWLWVDPESRHIIHRCPFLAPLDDKRFICSIHSVKPDICRDYPTLAHARRCLKGVFLQLTILFGEIVGASAIETLLMA